MNRQSVVHRQVVQWNAEHLPHARDAELTEDALRARANELADTIGNLVSRTVALARRLGVTQTGKFDASTAATW